MSDQPDTMTDSTSTVLHATQIGSSSHRAFGFFYYLIVSASLISLFSRPAVDIFDAHFPAEAYSYFVGNIYWTLSFASVYTVIFLGVDGTMSVFETIAKWVYSACKTIKGWASSTAEVTKSLSHNVLKSLAPLVGNFPQLAKVAFEKLGKYALQSFSSGWIGVLLLVSVSFVSLCYTKGLSPVRVYTSITTSHGWTFAEQSPEKTFESIASMVVEDASAPAIFKAMRMVVEMRRT